MISAETPLNITKKNSINEVEVIKKPSISDFEIGELVGVGNFGKVKKAINKKENNRVCVLKIIPKESIISMTIAS